MNQPSASQSPASNEQITGSTIVAILSIVLAAGWIAFAYYSASSTTDENGKGILLLHPIVPMLLISLLARIRHLIPVKGVVTILIAMIVIWLFIHLLDVLMPFIIGFGLAYFFRFLLNAMQDIPLPKGRRLQLSRGYARAILTVFVLGAFAMLFLYILPQIGKQSKEMSRGLARFYHQSVVPFVVGSPFQAFDIEPDESGVIYLGALHGLYRYEPGGDELQDMTNGNLIGRPIRAVTLASGEKSLLYVGTTRGLYVCANPSTKEKETAVWRPIETEIFTGKSVQAIGIPPYDTSQLYVGTTDGLYRSDDGGLTWKPIEVKRVNTTPETEFSAQSIAFSSGTAGMIYIGSNQGVYRSADAGETWSLVLLENPDDEPISTLTVEIIDGQEQLYATTLTGLYISQGEDGWKAVDWEIPGETKPISLFRPFAENGRYAGNEDALYRRTDPREEWHPVVQSRKSILSKLEKQQTLGGPEVVGRVREYLTTKLPTLARTGSEFVGQLVKGFSSIAIGFGGFLATTFLTLMVFIYASQSFGSYVQNFIGLFPQANRDNVRQYLVEIDQNLQSFLRGQVAVILIISIISITVYSIIGVPFALVVGLFAGLCNAIPTFGPFIGGGFAMLALLMGFAAGNFDGIGFLIRAAVLLGGIFGIQAVDNSLISPKVMSSAVDVDALLIMFGVIVGASILGFWGVILAIPTIVVIKSILTVSKQIRTEKH